MAFRIKSSRVKLGCAAYCVILSKLLNISLPQFTHFKNENNDTIFIRLKDTLGKVDKMLKNRD